VDPSVYLFQVVRISQEDTNHVNDGKGYDDEEEEEGGEVCNTLQLKLNTVVFMK
jgi:hypothetical protein